ncbi:hypothetical protein BJ742DRAFT_808707 [Cladochytrium replicatum]|nr:hypothetical protein BJ742DRAFT_808707 [Cladochytrium replicatum]
MWKRAAFIHVCHRKFVIVVIDVFENLVLTVGLLYVGSGVYQVIYTSGIVFTELMARVFLKRNVTIGRWIAVITASSLNLLFTRMSRRIKSVHPIQRRFGSIRLPDHQNSTQWSTSSTITS